MATHYMGNWLLMCGGNITIIMPVLLLTILCCPVGYTAGVHQRVGGVVSDRVMIMSSQGDIDTDATLKSMHQIVDDTQEANKAEIEMMEFVQGNGINGKKETHPRDQFLDEKDPSITFQISQMQLLSTEDSNTKYAYVNSMRGGGKQIRLKRAKRAAAAVDFDKESDPLLALTKLLANVQNAEECTRQEIDLAFGSSNVNDTLVYYQSFLDNSSIAVYAANLLNSFYCRQRSEDSIFYHEQMLYSIVRNIVENNMFISGSCIAFDSYAYTEDMELFAPCTYYETEARTSMVEEDMGTKLNYTSEQLNATEWFTGYKKNATDIPNLKRGWLIHRYNATANSPTENASYAFVTEEDGEWSSPYFDCMRTNRWLVTYSVPFYNHNGVFM